MENQYQKNIQNTIIISCLIISGIILLVKNHFQQNILKDPIEELIALLIFTFVSFSGLFTRLEINTVKELNRRGNSGLWVIFPLLLMGLYIIILNIGYQFITDTEIQKIITLGRIHKNEIILSFTAWTLSLSLAMSISQDNNTTTKGKPKMNKKTLIENKKLYNCTLKGKECIKPYHIQIAAKDDMECLKKVEKRYKSLGEATLIQLVGENNIELDYKVPEQPVVSKRPDFSEIEVKFICLGNPEQKDFIEETRWPEEIEADNESPYAALIKKA